MAGSFPVEKDRNSHEIPLKAEHQSMTSVLPAQKTQLQQAYNVGVQCGLVHVATPLQAIQLSTSSVGTVLPADRPKTPHPFCQRRTRSIALLAHLSSLAI